MCEANKTSLEEILSQLKCHFTWNLFKKKGVPSDLEDRVCEQIEYLDTKVKATMYNLLAYVKHLDKQDEEALQYLQKAEELIQREYTGQAEIRSLVTWGNYAWVYHHLGKQQNAQKYVDKVKQVCEKSPNPYSIECPEMYSEEGWALLKCGGDENKRAKVCFEKALQKEPKSPEFTCGLAIATFRLGDDLPPEELIDLLWEAIGLNSNNQYLKVLLALTLQNTNEEDEGERLVEEALTAIPCATTVLQQGAKFYQRKGDLDKGIELLEKALESTTNNARLHYSIGYLCRGKVLQISDPKTGMFSKSEELQELIKKAVGHFKKADGINKNIWHYLGGLYALSDQYEEAELYFQEQFSKELSPATKQKLHMFYGNFQLYQMKCEDKAIHHYVEGVKIDQESKEKEKMKTKLHRIATARLSKDKDDSKALHLLQFLKEQNR
ncbi:interferon-induced protein with tetratricopeptide repeats 2-like [Erinaceus europaeus]|uniref:Interferon-induced protein with tetratricopeptide repeats 2-like n=1 Tax=Erinaceus europaeus TaxID=9365 RepID=A0A1S3ANS6_ERIEU|nr:interferon-induced protein with tetratricopeptide repeats 2-like [Erinaceus europaeus]